MVWYRSTTDEQGVWQNCIAIGELIFIPMPAIGTLGSIKRKQLFCQLCTNLICHAITRKPLEVFMQAKERERQRPGSGEVENGRQRLFEQLARHALKHNSI